MIQVPIDKQLHILGGAAVAGVFLQFGPIPAFLAGVAAGIAKEAYDWFANWRAGTQVHTVDPYDFLATAGGGAASVAIATVIGKVGPALVSFIADAASRLV